MGSITADLLRYNFSVVGMSPMFNGEDLHLWYPLVMLYNGRSWDGVDGHI